MLSSHTLVRKKPQQPRHIINFRIQSSRWPRSFIESAFKILRPESRVFPVNNSRYLQRPRINNHIMLRQVIMTETILLSLTFSQPPGVLLRSICIQLVFDISLRTMRFPQYLICPKALEVVSFLQQFCPISDLLL